MRNYHEKRRGGYDQPVTMSFRTVNGTAKAGEDYIAKTGALTFAPGETTKTITIEVKHLALADNLRVEGFALLQPPPQAMRRTDDNVQREGGVGESNGS